MLVDGGDVEPSLGTNWIARAEAIKQQLIVGM